MTVTAEVSARPSLVALTPVEPAATPWTTPWALTVATAALSDAQAMIRPVRTPPAESRSVTDSGVVAPTTTVADAGVTVTEATGTTLTVTLAVSL